MLGLPTASCCVKVTGLTTIFQMFFITIIQTYMHICMHTQKSCTHRAMCVLFNYFSVNSQKIEFGNYFKHVFAKLRKYKTTRLE